MLLRSGLAGLAAARSWRGTSIRWRAWRGVCLSGHFSRRSAWRARFPPPSSSTRRSGGAMAGNVRASLMRRYCGASSAAFRPPIRTVGRHARVARSPRLPRRVTIGGAHCSRTSRANAPRLMRHTGALSPPLPPPPPPPRARTSPRAPPRSPSSCRASRGPTACALAPCASAGATDRARASYGRGWRARGGASRYSHRQRSASFAAATWPGARGCSRALSRRRRRAMWARSITGYASASPSTRNAHTTGLSPALPRRRCSSPR